MLANFKKYMITIFLTEDDREDQQIFKEALDEIEISFHIANFNNGQELLDHLDENTDLPPDVIFLDLNMPVMSGIECLKKLKANPLYKDIFIVIYSTSGAESDINKTFEAGANSYIVKPSDFNKLKQMLRELFFDGWKGHFAASNLKSY